MLENKELNLLIKQAHDETYYTMEHNSNTFKNMMIHVPQMHPEMLMPFQNSNIPHGTPGKRD